MNWKGFFSRCPIERPQTYFGFSLWALGFVFYRWTWRIEASIYHRFICFRWGCAVILQQDFNRHIAIFCMKRRQLVFLGKGRPANWHSCRPTDSEETEKWLFHSSMWNWTGMELRKCFSSATNINPNLNGLSVFLLQCSWAVRQLSPLQWYVLFRYLPSFKASTRATSSY